METGATPVLRCGRNRPSGFNCMVPARQAESLGGLATITRSAMWAARTSDQRQAGQSRHIVAGNQQSVGFGGHGGRHEAPQPALPSSAVAAISLFARFRLIRRNKFVAIGHFQFLRSFVMENAKRVNIPTGIPRVGFLDVRPSQLSSHTPRSQAKGCFLAAKLLPILHPGTAGAAGVRSSVYVFNFHFRSVAWLDGFGLPLLKTIVRLALLFKYWLR